MGVADCSVNGADKAKMKIKHSLLLKNKYIHHKYYPLYIQYMLVVAMEMVLVIALAHITPID